MYHLFVDGQTQHQPAALSSGLPTPMQPILSQAIFIAIVLSCCRLDDVQEHASPDIWQGAEQALPHVSVPATQCWGCEEEQQQLIRKARSAPG